MAGIRARERQFFPDHGEDVVMPVPLTVRWTGSEVTARWSGDISGFSITGNKGTNVGGYTATFTPLTGKRWADTHTREPRTQEWSISRALLNAASPSYAATSFTYDGAAFTMTLLFDSQYIVLTGDVSASAAGNYTVVATPDANHLWADQTSVARSTAWSVVLPRLSVISPSVTGTYTYTGSAITPVLNLSAADLAKVTLSGGTSGTSAGSYTITVTPVNALWADGTSGAKTASWSIGRAKLSVNAPQFSQSSFTWSGSAWNISNYLTTSFVTLAGTLTGTAAGTYSGTATPDANHTWANGSTAAVAFSWTIGKKALSSNVPLWASTAFTIDGGTFTMSLTADSAYIVTGGTLSAVDIGSYTATARPDGNHTWKNGSTSTVSTTWKINSFSKTTAGDGTFTVRARHTFHVTLVGGGGSGAHGSLSFAEDDEEYWYRGGGGGKPGSSVKFAVVLDPGNYHFTVGAGGSALAPVYKQGIEYVRSVLQVFGENGKVGGNTVFQGHTASGGQGGIDYDLAWEEDGSWIGSYTGYGGSYYPGGRGGNVIYNGEAYGEYTGVRYSVTLTAPGAGTTGSILITY